MNSCAILFTKPVCPGRVKTRLIGAVTAEEAARLHGAFLSDVVQELRRGPFSLQIAWAFDGAEGSVHRPAETLEIEGFAQVGGNLGERLYQGLCRAAGSFSRVAAIGSDHPELRAETVAAGFELLDTADVVVGPTTDGGYYLIATRREVLEPELFEGVPWSTERVLEVTLERCKAAGRTVALLPVGRDIDVPEDLDELAKRLGLDKEIEPVALDDASPGGWCVRTTEVLRDLGRWSSVGGPGL